jgi:CheY-like chemotaxis protein
VSGLVSSSFFAFFSGFFFFLVAMVNPPGFARSGERRIISPFLIVFPDFSSLVPLPIAFRTSTRFRCRGPLSFEISVRSASDKTKLTRNRFWPLRCGNLLGLMPNLRVLIVDDHEAVRKGVAGILESRGDIEVVGEGANGEEAVRKAKELNPDLIIMDFTMPVLDGLEAARRILKVSPEMPILMFSMHQMDALTQAAKLAGARGFVTKGESAENLLSAVDRVTRNEPFFVLVS